MLSSRHAHGFAPDRIRKYVKAKIEAWRVDYNQRRPHSSLGHLTPNEYAQQRQRPWTAEAASL